MAMERLLPAEIVNRRKHGFATPYDDWLRASLGEEVKRRYSAGSPLAELIDPAAAHRLVDEHRRGRADHKAILYCLLELSEWHAAFVEAREPVTA
jgi:asparagine synthase (glutamine-hydrolysing)